MEQLYEEERLSNRMALPAWKFRCEVYAFGVKKVIFFSKFHDNFLNKHLIIDPWDIFRI